MATRHAGTMGKSPRPRTRFKQVCFAAPCLHVYIVYLYPLNVYPGIGVYKEIYTSIQVSLCACSF